MNNTNDFNNTITANWEKSMGVLQRIFDLAKPSAVYSEPVQSGEYTVITASEVSIGVGVGQGMGSGGEEKPSATGEPAVTAGGSGSGGGGGGGGWSRPVAVISIGPRGVHVEPVVDVTKLGLAFFTMIGSAVFMARKMRK
ncbi:MAG: hypothetical protein KF893_23545 [Caldilineaceae bacterium]|nr:hypothetical protein [Caldilineaceae bacterium]